MTRDEAIRAFRNAADPASFRIASWIDRFVALGILKLDDPLEGQSPFFKAYDALFEFVPSLAYADFKDILEKAGLKIVEK